MEVLKKVWERMKKEALSILLIMLLTVYIIISYRTYIIQQNRYELDRLAYQLTLYLEELEHQNNCMNEILEILESELRNVESR